MLDFNGMTAVITGASGGIGRGLALQLVSEGCHVAVADVRDEPLAETMKLCQAAALAGTRVSKHHCDVTKIADIARFRDEVEAEHGKVVNLLFNNAGLAATGQFLEMSRQRFNQVFAVSFTGTVECSRSFLPMLVASKFGYVVNLSSVNAWWCAIGPANFPFKSPPHAPYSAAKAAVSGFSQALMQDARQNYPHVRVAAVHPGHVGTDIAALAPDPETKEQEAQLVALARRTGLPNYQKMTPSQIHKALGTSFRDRAPLTPAEAATLILDGMRAGKTRILVGEDAVIIDLLKRCFPRLIYNDWFMATVLGPWAISAAHTGALTNRYFGGMLPPLGRLLYPATILTMLYYIRRFAKFLVPRASL